MPRSRIESRFLGQLFGLFDVPIIVYSALHPWVKTVSTAASLSLTLLYVAGSDVERLALLRNDL